MYNNDFLPCYESSLIQEAESFKFGLENIFGKPSLVNLRKDEEFDERIYTRGNFVIMDYYGDLEANYYEILSHKLVSILDGIESSVSKTFIETLRMQRCLSSTLYNLTFILIIFWMRVWVTLSGMLMN